MKKLLMFIVLAVSASVQALDVVDSDGEQVFMDNGEPLQVEGSFISKCKNLKAIIKNNGSLVVQGSCFFMKRYYTTTYTYSRPKVYRAIKNSQPLSKLQVVGSSLISQEDLMKGLGVGTQGMTFTIDNR